MFAMFHRYARIEWSEKARSDDCDTSVGNATLTCAGDERTRRLKNVTGQPSTERTLCGYRAQSRDDHHGDRPHCHHPVANQGIVLQRRFWRWFRLHPAHATRIREDVVSVHDWRCGRFRRSLDPEQLYHRRLIDRWLVFARSLPPGRLQPSSGQQLDGMCVR